MKPIETRWKGWRFRSRTEARWAVFLEAAGIQFEYEPEGVVLPSGPYLPDFRLTGFPGSDFPKGGEHEDVWLEIKGGEPTELERQRCAELSAASGCPVLLAVGVPDFAEQVLLFDLDADERFRDLIALTTGYLGFMNVGDPTSNAICVGRGPRDDEPEPDETDPEFEKLWDLARESFCRVLGIKGGRLPMGQAKLGISERMRRAYDAARSARFEFGETDQRWPR